MILHFFLLVFFSSDKLYDFILKQQQRFKRVPLTLNPNSFNYKNFQKWVALVPCLWEIDPPPPPTPTVRQQLLWFDPWQERWENFLLQSWLCVLTYSLYIPPHVLLPWHVKDPGHSEKCRWQVTPKTHIIYPWPNKVRVGWPCCVGIVYEFTRAMWSLTTHQGSIVQSLLSRCRLILAEEWNWWVWADLHFNTHKKRKKKQKGTSGEWLSNLPPKFLHARKKPQPPCAAVDDGWWVMRSCCQHHQWQR